MTRNRHHVLFSRAHWSATSELHELRSNPSLVIPMDVEVHAELHRAITLVPALDHFMAQSVLSSFKPTPGDNITSIYNLMRSIEVTRKSRKRDAIQRGLGELVVHSLRLQIPYIKEGQLRGIIVPQWQPVHDTEVSVDGVAVFPQPSGLIDNQ